MKQNPDYAEYLELIAKRDSGRWSPPTDRPFKMEIEEIMPLRVVVAKYMFMVLQHFYGNRTHAAKAMDISVRTLRDQVSSWWGGTKGDTQNLVTFTCKLCGRVNHTGHAATKYCSQDCSKLARKQRSKANKERRKLLLKEVDLTLER